MRLLDELRTLRRPSRGPALVTLQVGDRAPTLRGREIEGRAVVVFVRHVGCPFAEATVDRLRDAASAEPGIGWWLVSHVAAEPTEVWLREIGGQRGFAVVADPGLEEYMRWGVGPSGWRHFLGLRSLRGVAALRRRGIVNRAPAGSRWQRAGAFAVTAGGVVAWVHRPAHAADLPDLVAAGVAAGVATGRDPG